MHTSKFRFTLDLQRTQSQVSIPITLGDTGRTWYISFSDGSLPFALAEGCLAKLEIKRPTGTFLEEFCPIEDGMTVRYAFSQNANTAAVEGLHECAVILYDSEENVIGSPRFTMIVTDRLISSDDLNLSDENRSAIDAIITAEASRQAAEAGRVNAEAERISAETARTSAFDSLKNEMKTAVDSIVSPTVSVSQTTSGYEMVVTDKNGEKKYPLSMNNGGDGNGAGTEVMANPDEEATETLTKIKIGDIVYTVGSNYAIAEEVGF